MLSIMAYTLIEIMKHNKIIYYQEIYRQKPSMHSTPNINFFLCSMKANLFLYFTNNDNNNKCKNRQCLGCWQE